METTESLTPAPHPPIPPAQWRKLAIVVTLILLAALGILGWLTPVKDGSKAWTAQMSDGGWMAWSFPVAFFFWCIACLLCAFTLMALRAQPVPKRGILRIETTAGDRLFISLLGSAFIALAFLFFAGPPLWWALPICLVYAMAVFRLV